MNFDWNHLLYKLVQNAHGKKINGEDGDWESALYQLLHETYKQSLDREDKAVASVLIVLHEALQGKVNLGELADLCINMSRAAER